MPDAADRELGKKKKKWRTTEIAPNYYHADLFRANFPLVQVHRVPAGLPFPVADKFEGLKLDSKATRKARKLWSRESVKVSRFYRAPTNEKQSFPHHLALFEGLKPFTVPPPVEVQKVTDFNHLKRKRDEREWAASVDDDDECNGFDIETAVEEIRGDGFSSHSEGDEDSADMGEDLEEHEDMPSGFAAAVLHVYDYRPLKRRKVEDADPDRVAGILESKFTEDKSDSKVDAIYQGAYYGSKYAMANIQKGHGTPVYIIVMASQRWSYAQLLPEGYVQICDGQIDPRSLEAFAEHQQITGRTESDLNSLQKRLAAGTEFYRKNFRDNPQALYCDGPMVVGHLYVRDEWFALPTTELAGFRSLGSRRLFDGLMRLVVGDSVLQMSEEELERRVQVNEVIQEMLEEAVQ